MASFQLNILSLTNHTHSGWSDIEIPTHKNVASIVESLKTRRGLEFAQDIAVKQWGFNGAAGGIHVVDLESFNGDDVLKLKISGYFVSKKTEADGTVKKVDHPFKGIVTLMDAAPTA